MAQLVGREKESKILTSLVNIDNSEFVVIYGRRRIGKTFLIREYFKNTFDFQLTGLANSTTTQQLSNFHAAFQKHFKKTIPKPKSWFDAFQHLIVMLEKSKKHKKIVFLDELPWMDTPKSDFISALEHFWNSWASARKDIFLIVCGSATSWITNKLINNKGGLHNRLTSKIKLSAFTLNECEQYLRKKNILWNRHQIIECYMIMGGIPYYLSLLKPELSLAQNIDLLFFSQNGMLRNEFDNLYASLFRHSENHVKIIETLSQKTEGFTRKELIAYSKIPNGGGTTKKIEELESSGFIKRYTPIGKKKRDSQYQLTDFYSMFYFHFINGYKINDENYWMNSIDSPNHRAWSGFAFEQVCMAHINEIKVKLGISGIKTNSASWRSKDTETNVQIDLLIDRNDQVISLCEMKYSINEFTINKSYAENLRNKIGTFKSETKTRKAVFLTMITTYGIKQNEYSMGLVQNELTMNDLF
jgi:AAA+ ATPase superfamily predicted ATPase